MKIKNGFNRELKRAGLTQRRAAQLLGRGHITVSRWCRDGGDAQPVPQYARVLVRCWAMLPAEARALLAGAWGAFPFFGMERGDSFEFLSRERQRIETPAGAYARWRPGVKFAIHPVGDRHRIWRTT